MANYFTWTFFGKYDVSIDLDLLLVFVPKIMRFSVVDIWNYYVALTFGGT